MIKFKYLKQFEYKSVNIVNCFYWRAELTQKLIWYFDSITDIETVKLTTKGQELDQWNFSFCRITATSFNLDTIMTPPPSDRNKDLNDYFSWQTSVRNDVLQNKSKNTGNIQNSWDLHTTLKKDAKNISNYLKHDIDHLKSVKHPQSREYIFGMF